MTALAEFSTCELSDALLKLGVPHGGHIPDLSMISPSPLSISANQPFRLCGPAFTVKMVHASEITAPKLQGHFVDLIPEGTVVFVASPRGAYYLLPFASALY
jgi:regulator of RNase E activity RraA